MYLDLIIVLLYLAGITAYGVLAGRKTSTTLAGYFLGGRTFGWALIGFSLFATNISTNQFMSTSGLAQQIGVAAINNDLIGALMMALSAVFFIPLYIRIQLCTMTEFLEHRYSRSAKLIYSITFLLTSTLTMPPGIYLGGLAMLGLFGLPSEHLGLACLLIGGSVGLYSVLGGLTAVVKTDMIQAGLMIVGGMLVTYMAVDRVGGLGALVEAAPPHQLELLQPPGSRIPWTALPGIVIASAFFAFCNAGMLQRALGARDVRHAQLGMLFAAFLKFLSIPLFAVAGMAAIQIFPDAGGDQTYALMVRELLPVGLSGLVMAGLFSALLSSADSGVCAISSVIAYDIHPVLRKEATVDQRLRFGKWAAAAIIVFAVTTAPFASAIDNVYLFLLRLHSFLVVPIGVAFMFGRFVRRINNIAAVTTMATGMVAGLFYVTCTSVPALNGVLPEWLAKMHFYELLPFLWAALVLLLFVVTYLTPPPPADKLAVLDKSRTQGATTVVVGIPWWQSFPFWFGVFMVCLIALYVVF